MKIDLLLDPFGASWDSLLEMAEAAESLGFDGLWTWDHLSGQAHGADRVLESWTVLSALASCTTSVTIGPLVLNVANRVPGVLAIMAATLQEISRGRLIIGMGAGGGRNTPYWREQLAIGHSVGEAADRRRHLVDAIASCRQIWSGRVEATDPRTGGSELIDGFSIPEPPPPIIIGGFGPKMAELAGLHGDGFNTQATHPQLGRLIEIARSAHERSRRPGRFEISGFGRLDASLVDKAGPLDRLILIASPRDGVGPITSVATSIGLSGPSSGKSD